MFSSALSSFLFFSHSSLLTINYGTIVIGIIIGWHWLRHSPILLFSVYEKYLLLVQGRSGVHGKLAPRINDLALMQSSFPDN